MNEKKVIKNNELKNFGSVESFAEKARALLIQQKGNWQLLNEGYLNLGKTETREFKLNSCTINVQYNPGRIISSTAKVDEQSIKERKCFLCRSNLPEEQKAVEYGNDFLILANPFPIFNEHFTISKIKHIPQRIKKSFEDLLNLSKDLGKYYTVFYNGPECGASAPDHLHFQACSKNTLPFEKEYNFIKENFTRSAGMNGKLEVYASKNFLRKFISFESGSKIELLNVFKILYAGYLRISAGAAEPKMNIISSFDNNMWRVIIFPRRNHRPNFYFKNDDNKIIISPAAVDFGGICITPRKEDYEKITKQNLEEMFNEVSVSAEFFEFLINRCEMYFR